MRTQQRILVSLLLALLVSGCELFPGQEDSDFGDDSDESETDTDDTSDDGEQPPSQGLRVYPKYMLQDLPAIVTIEIDGITPEPCELDGAAEGGYLCDASELPAGGIATIVVEKDGFASATRNAQLVFGQITALEVHLAIEGGPTGVWSECQAAGQFTTCADLCATFQGSCAVTSCATGDVEWPIATYETFTDVECTTSFERIAAACESELPFSGSTVALRCCCAG
jgi:hypothetical protein